MQDLILHFLAVENKQLYLWLGEKQHVLPSEREKQALPMVRMVSGPFYLLFTDEQTCVVSDMLFIVWIK